MGKGKKTQTQTNVTAPWGPAQPLLMKGLDRAMGLYDAGELTPDPFGPRLAAESPWTADSRNMMANIALAGNPVIPAASSAYMGLLNDRYGELGAVEDAALRRSVPAAASYFANSGMLNSSAAAEGIGEAAARAIAPIKYGAWNADRANTLGALGMAPTMADMMYGDARALGLAGAAEDARRQAELDDRANLYYETQDRDYEDLIRMSQLGLGFGGAGGTSTGTTTARNRGGFLGTLGNIVGMAGALFGSDRRLKENIRPVGETSVSVPVYEYNYKGDPEKRVGVMSDEVPKSMVHKHPSGFDMVDYRKLL